MCNMNSLQFKKTQDFLGLNRQQLSEMLCCSLSAIDAYRADKGVRKRNIPALVEKILKDEVIKRGGNVEVVMGE